MRTSPAQLGWGFAAALLSAAALWRGTGLEPAWWLTWLAPWPVLAFGLRASAPAAAVAAFVAWAAGSLNLWSYYRTTIGVPSPAVFVATAVPAWDFAVDGWLHSRMAALRGVEGGFAVARAARGGRLTLSDDRGRITGEADSAAAPMASVLATVPVGPAGTPYARLGDWFAWLSCGVLALALVPSRRARSET